MSIIEQKPNTTNQIKNKKPNIIKNSNVLQGYIANSFNGGHLKPIGFAPIMAGTKVMQHNIKLNIKMLTPKTPVYQKLSATVRTFFVPNSRVWHNWEKFDAQKGGSTTNKINKMPSLGGKYPTVTLNKNPQSAQSRAITCDTDIWRDSWLSTYIPRYQSGMDAHSVNETIPYPEYNILPLRGFKAIYNDYLRNKEYDEEMEEFFTDTMSNSEYEQTFSLLNNASFSQMFNVRGRRNNSYYTNYRTELLGKNAYFSGEEWQNDYIANLVESEKKLAEYRDQAENAQRNDWDIIAEQHGSKLLTEGKVQLLSTRTFGINYKAVTQDTYNTNETIEEDFQVLGEQGAYSYTETELNLYNFQEFKESGFIHIIIQVSADSVFETGFDRTLMNVNALDQYRPELKELKDDVLYEIEKCGTGIDNIEELTKVTGYKRKFSEYFKLPNSLNGDILNDGYYQTTVDNMQPEKIFKIEDGTATTIKTILPKETFQFFEKDDKYTRTGQAKNIWQDYTDLLINKNQAIENEVYHLEQDAYFKPVSIVKGANQFITLGIQTIVADLPIDESIKDDFEKWGEL